MMVIEKQAWFALAVCSAAIIAVIAIYSITGSFGRATGGRGVLGLSGLTPFIGSRRKRRGEVIIDERDGAILHSAGRIAFGTFWVALVGTVIGLLAVAGNQATVRVGILATALGFAWLLISMVHSVSVLWMCRLPRAR
jgi:membrane-anchored protein YejM (alkaline phosphatase superfamily)